MADIDKNGDSSAASPGAILKRCREYHGITLEEAAESTKISENYLEALEDERLREFASLAYLKGFLRIYAAYLGLNPEDLIRLYEKLYGTDRTGKDRPTSLGGESPRKKYLLQKLAMPAFFLILILITSAVINRSPSPPTAPQPRTAAPVPAAAVQKARTSSGRTAAPKPIEPDTGRQGGDPAASTPAVTGKAQPEPSKGFIVRMKVTQSGSLTVTIDGSTSQGYELTVGDSIEWKADRSISLELSNAGGVEAELNGRALKPFGSPGRPAVVVLDAEGVKQ